MSDKITSAPSGLYGPCTTACGRYFLPLIDFAAGSTQNLLFHIWKRHAPNCTPLDVSNCVADFSVVSYENKTGKLLLVKEMSMGDDCASFKVRLEAGETADWKQGKYIYQISIADGSGTVQVPYQGVMYVQSNIHRVFSGGTQ